MSRTRGFTRSERAAEQQHILVLAAAATRCKPLTRSFLLLSSVQACARPLAQRCAGATDSCCFSGDDRISRMWRPVHHAAEFIRVFTMIRLCAGRCVCQSSWGSLCVALMRPRFAVITTGPVAVSKPLLTAHGSRGVPRGAVRGGRVFGTK